MANYRESTISGTQYVRCAGIEVVNHYGKLPRVIFREERVRVFGEDDVVRESVGQIEMPYDGSRTIPLVNPATGEPTGQTVTWQDMYVMLYSAYLAEALDRDAQSLADAGPV